MNFCGTVIGTGNSKYQVVHHKFHTQRYGIEPFSPRPTNLSRYAKNFHFEKKNHSNEISTQDSYGMAPNNLRILQISTHASQQLHTLR